MTFTLPTWVCGLINGPLIFLNLIFNIFYSFCLILPTPRGQRKQPLTTLLGFLVSCCVTFCVVSITLTSLGIMSQNSSKLHSILEIIIQHNMDYSMTTCAWLNFYYYLQIVPSRCALIQWARTNIKCTIYTIVAIDGVITLLARLTTEIAPNLLLNECDFQLNFTFTVDHATEMYSRISFYIMTSHYMLILIVMVLSSWSTVSYLHRHMKRVTKSGTSFSSSKLRGQLRVTVTGICQGVVFFLYTTHYIVHGFGRMYSTDFRVGRCIILTTTTLFITCTTVTLGLGQSVFRERIIDICKAFKMLLVSDRKTS